MARISPVDVTVRFVPFEPDGSSCEVCGDTIYLKGLRPVFVVGGKKLSASELRFCQSCGEALESGRYKKKEWWKDGNEQF